jgi:hypothetical protein
MKQEVRGASPAATGPQGGPKVGFVNLYSIIEWSEKKVYEME